MTISVKIVNLGMSAVNEEWNSIEPASKNHTVFLPHRPLKDDHIIVREQDWYVRRVTWQPKAPADENPSEWDYYDCIVHCDYNGAASYL